MSAARAWGLSVLTLFTIGASVAVFKMRAFSLYPTFVHPSCYLLHVTLMWCGHFLVDLGAIWSRLWSVLEFSLRPSLSKRFISVYLVFVLVVERQWVFTAVYLDVHPLAQVAKCMVFLMIKMYVSIFTF